MLQSRAGRFRTGRVFYGSVLLVGGILYGFSFTYLRPLLHGDAFPALIHVHAALWFGWFGLFSIQAYLIGRTKLRWHGRLGIGVAAYTAALVSVSLILAVRTIGRDAHLVTGGIEAVSTIIPLSQILMFLMFFTWVGSYLPIGRRPDNCIEPTYGVVSSSLPCAPRAYPWR